MVFYSYMKLSFTDLFEESNHQIRAKKDIRIGALIIPNGHTIDPSEPNLGLPINDWKNKTFSVEIEQETICIKQIL